MREIKFRAWDKSKDKMCYGVIPGPLVVGSNQMAPVPIREALLMQFTGLKDKSVPCKEVYESDIIDIHGKIKGNTYEIAETNKDQSDLVVQGFGTKAWVTTYQKAVDRGCEDSE